MRFYAFGNYYLSSIQQGIQAAHCAVDMFIKYKPRKHCSELGQVEDWAENHKTMVLLNGGNQRDLIELVDFFSCVPENSFAWGFFREDCQSLNEAFTCVGIILPERIYESASLLRNKVFIHKDDNGNTWVNDAVNNCDHNLSPWELELCERLNSCGLAK